MKPFPTAAEFNRYWDQRSAEFKAKWAALDKAAAAKAGAK